MKTSTSNLTNRFILLVVLVAIISCDSLTQNDSIIPEKQVTFIQSDYYVLLYSSIIIDLKAVIKESFSDVTLSISENPQKGTLSYVDTFLLKYRPGTDFTGGQDKFVFSAMSDGKILAKSTVRINMKKTREDFPCNLIAVEDKIKAEPGLSVSIPILENDWVCGIEKSDINISIHTQPRWGQAVVEGESILYTPGPEFKSRDQFIYKLSSSSDEGAFGIISITDRKLHSTIMRGHFGAMVFVDENTGYIAGNSIYKTSDGGEHWTQVFNRETFGNSFTDIYFLNANEGFAVYPIGCDEELYCGGGMAITKDGGVSWKLTSVPSHSFMGASPSVFFTSSTTGFIAGSVVDLNLNDSQILKTEDGGETWKKVLTNSNQALTLYGRGHATIKFADSNTGYVCEWGRIFITLDAGDSWQIFASDEQVSSIALNAEDILFAPLTILDSDTLPTSIVRFQGASIFNEVVNIPSQVQQLEFSPSGNVGFAVGIRGNRLESPSRTLSINTSIDKGETWTEEYIDKDADYLSPCVFFAATAVASDNVVYILYTNYTHSFIFKYSNK